MRRASVVVMGAACVAVVAVSLLVGRPGDDPAADRPGAEQAATSPAPRSTVPQGGQPDPTPAPRTTAPRAGQPDPTPAPRSSGPPRVADGELWFAEMDLTGSAVVTPDAQLQDVRMSATDVLIGESGMQAGTLSVDAVVPFPVVAEQMGPDVRIVAAGDEARVLRTVEVLGRRIALVATGAVSVDGGEVVVEPTAINVGGPAWVESRLGDVARELVTIRHSVRGLPAGLVLRDVSVTDEGFRVKLSGTDVALGG